MRTIDLKRGRVIVSDAAWMIHCGEQKRSLRKASTQAKVQRGVLYLGYAKP